MLRWRGSQPNDLYRGGRRLYVHGGKHGEQVCRVWDRQQCLLCRSVRYVCKRSVLSGDDGRRRVYELQSLRRER